MKSIQREHLAGLLERWSQRYKVFAPCRQGQGECIFDRFDEETFTLDYRKPHLPPKAEYLPQSEVLFEVRNGEYRAPMPEGDRLFFGIRACDMMGLRQASHFMNRDVVDPYYRSRNEGAVTVVMACKGPQNETCFCTTTGSGPVSSQGFDLQLYDFGDRFLVEAGSPRGNALLEEDMFDAVDAIWAQGAIQTFRDEASRAIPVVPAVSEAMEMLRNENVSDEVWDYFGTKCIVCGGCAFVCPTCTCFNVTDSVRDRESGVRVRAWDACLYGGFTKEASGHNPRGTQALRLKRRHEHKLRYYSEGDILDGLCGCVGCGRCSDFCPVGIGTLEVVRAISRNTLSP